ncbi:sugar phosphate permease [Metallosphaera yellowstonensis MK1]|jgi:putative MFS transporter|uniref:Sugar phosphate permease n=1 Tax=Metallosphaera yellowstonensis MK1 TaxID=671065 RepID=H2C0N8_9CREN|nr:MFS transporter [Metallosphaera yellowstonensis]EHP71300.1 sugar phosphate permease [Metallosphaera yellowstonensis MK1]
MADKSLTWDKVKERLFSNLDLSKEKWFHYKMLLLVGGGVFVDAYNTVVLTPGLNQLKAVFHLTALLVTAIGVAVVIGTGIGALISGYLVDKIGRKTMFVIDLVFFVIIAGLSAISINGYMLFLLRLLVGIGVGLDYPIASSYLAEFVPVKSRGKFMAYDILFYPLGALAAILIGYWLLGVGGLNAWRYMVASAIIPAVIIAVARLGSPESPRWLLERNRTDEAITVVENIIERPLTDEEKTLIKTTKPETNRNTYYKELLTKFSKNAAFIAIYYTGYQIAFVAAGVLSSLFATSLSLPVETASALFWIENIIAILIIAFTIDRFGRKPLANVGWIGSILAFLALIFVPSTIGKLTLLVIYSLLALFLNFQGGLHLDLSAELAPTRIRGTMEGWKQGVSRIIAATFSTVVFPLMSFHESLYVMMAAAVVALIATIVMLPETKGKSLEQLWK